MYISKLRLACLIGIASLAVGITSYNVGYAVGERDTHLSLQTTLRAYDSLLKRAMENQIKANILAGDILLENMAMVEELENRRLEDETIKFISPK